MYHLSHFFKRVSISSTRNRARDLRTAASDPPSIIISSHLSFGSLTPLFKPNKNVFYLNKGPRRCALPQRTAHLKKASAGRDWQRRDSIPGTLAFRDYSDVTLLPLHGWMLKNYSATNNSTSRVHILQVLRYPLSLLQPTQQHRVFFSPLNDA